MSHIHAVIFDADGVMNDGRLFSLEEDFGIPSEKLQEFFIEKFPDCLTGKADLKDEIEPYFNKWGWEGSVEEILQYWFESSSAIHKDMWQVASTLKENNVPVYLATNQEKYRTEYMKEHMGYGNLFKEIFSSASVGSKKPSEDFFLYLKNKIGVTNSSSLLFWDDTKENVDAALALGFTAHQFIGFEDFQEKMKKYFSFL